MGQQWARSIRSRGCDAIDVAAAVAMNQPICRRVPAGTGRAGTYPHPWTQGKPRRTETTHCQSRSRLFFPASMCKHPDTCPAVCKVMAIVGVQGRSHHSKCLHPTAWQTIHCNGRCGRADDSTIRIPPRTVATRPSGWKKRRSSRPCDSSAIRFRYRTMDDAILRKNPLNQQRTYYRFQSPKQAITAATATTAMNRIVLNTFGCRTKSITYGVNVDSAPNTSSGP